MEKLVLVSPDSKLRRRSIKSRIAKFILKLFGWKVIGVKPEYKKYLLLCEPHTSNWDFIFGVLAMYAYGMKSRFIIKAEVMFFPLNMLMKSLGAIPIDRSKKSGQSNVDLICAAIDKTKEGAIAISPKGTRKKTIRLKSGFYYIAKRLNIPVCYGYFDYKKKTIGLGETRFMEGTLEEEMKYIFDFYKDKTPKHIKYNTFQ